MQQAAPHSSAYGLVTPPTPIARTRGQMAAGAKIVDEPTLHDYGEDYWADRSYGAIDPEGHMWWFTQRIRDPRA